jgi:hypothetical protein
MKKPFHVIEHLGNDGVRVEAIGFTGNACEKVTKQIMDALAGEVKSSVKKPDYYKAVTTGAKQRA